MAKKRVPNSNPPLTFDIEEKLLKGMETFQKKTNAKTLSEVIRLALNVFNFEKYEKIHKKHKQVSVRLPMEVKEKLYLVSDRKKVSIGELLRVAINHLCAQKIKPQMIKAMATKKKTPTKKSTAKRKTTLKTKKAPTKKKTSVAKKKTTLKKKTTAVKKKTSVAKKKTTAKKKTSAAKKRTTARKR